MEDKKTKTGYTNKAFDGTDDVYLPKDDPPTYDEVAPESQRCGWGPISGDCLQKLNSIRWMVVWLCIFGFIEGAAVNGVVNIVLTTLEKRFGFRSSESGLIVSSTDIGATIFVLFVSYGGAQGHKPKILASGSLLMAIGSFLFILPHILAGNYDYLGGDSGNSTGQVCEANRTDTCDSQVSSTSGTNYLAVFMIAQMVHGIGFTPCFTLGAAYIDENSTPEQTAFYMGLVYALTALGVAAGYMGGGQFLNIFVDIGRVDTSSVAIDGSDPRWVGAWWIGFILTSILFVIIAIPIFAYPKTLPGSEKIRAMKKQPAPKKDEEKQTICQRIAYFPKAIWILIKNPAFVLIVLGGSAETLIIQGLGAFAPKILQEKFDSNPAEAGLIVGVVTLLGGAGGMVLGGTLINRFKMTFKRMLYLCCCLSVVAGAIGAGFFLNCQDSAFAGINTAYGVNNLSTPTNGLTGYCNSHCLCEEREFQPVCGQDGVTYFSPCHAGCSEDVIKEGFSTTYLNCSCVTATLINVGKIDLYNSTAVTGECAKECSIFWAFIAILFLGMLATFTTVTPVSMAILRCVPEEHRALGLGIQWVGLRLLGTIPGPVLTGTVIDSACAVWQDICDARGICWVYDRYSMSWRLFLWWIAVKVFSFTAFLISSKIYNPPEPKLTKEVNGDNDKKNAYFNPVTESTYM